MLPTGCISASSSSIFQWPYSTWCANSWCKSATIERLRIVVMPIAPSLHPCLPYPDGCIRHRARIQDVNECWLEIYRVLRRLQFHLSILILPGADGIECGFEAQTSSEQMITKGYNDYRSVLASSYFLEPVIRWMQAIMITHHGCLSTSKRCLQRDSVKGASGKNWSPTGLTGCAEQGVV